MSRELQVEYFNIVSRPKTPIFELDGTPVFEIKNNRCDSTDSMESVETEPLEEEFSFNDFMKELLKEQLKASCELKECIQDMKLNKHTLGLSTKLVRKKTQDNLSKNDPNIV